MKISYQGVEGCYSYIVCNRLFPNCSYIGCDTFTDAFDRVIHNEVDYAVIPIENSNAGRVTDVHSILKNTSLHIIEEYYLRIEHMLIGNKGTTMNDIKEVISHPQALAQCSLFIQANQFKAIVGEDTAKSCVIVKEGKEKTKAAIASELAAKVYDMEIVKRNIENDSTNTTRFVVFTKNENECYYDEKEKDKYITSMRIEIKTINDFGEVMKKIKDNNMNVRKIEIYNKDFMINKMYIEVNAHKRDERFTKMMNDINNNTKEIFIFGSYRNIKV